ncbi:MAG TPA: PilZ domain-containing protein [Terriglobales bacterium]|nr:PilZ domain-containing protein [Terriglobales bacterium]
MATRLETSIGKRRHKRIKMVLPVKVSSRDAANNLISELAHTLDITPDGARIGAVRHPLKAGDKLTLQYRQRKLQFRVVWVKAMQGTREYQVGLEAVANDSWGIDLPETDLIDEYRTPVS